MNGMNSHEWRGPHPQHDRIAELEAEVLEQCRLNSMGAEREAALLGKVERLERQRDELLAVLEETQWTDFYHADWGVIDFCPSCRSEKKPVHAKDCKIASIIARVKGEIE